MQRYVAGAFAFLGSFVSADSPCIIPEENDAEPEDDHYDDSCYPEHDPDHGHELPRISFTTGTLPCKLFGDGEEDYQ
eukprot:CAMPEP_0170169212 /NCGR_PEP_ID=MMETSP0040_2-20121228/2148_1 /TAXON_ID=641309 /ORGANISM="Lotharella oceanica, Strain CCMP622" /LENGTH=76 /DNA_ID=CAMNT_0010407839 /DNA_START=75 /DNA_END=305 /DNA_ORIENTATION=-